MQYSNYTTLTKSHKKTLKKDNGFSLIEVLITIAIAGVALGIAIPNMGSFLAQMRVDNEVSQIQRLLLTTRNAAINTGANASFCVLDNNDDCEDSNDWTGRIGIVTIDGLVKEKEAIKDGDSLDFDFNLVSYGPDGQLTNINNIGLFTYCPDGYEDYARGVDLSLAGRAYLTSDIDDDGIDDDRNGNSVTCD